MKKLLPIIIVVVVLVGGVIGAWWFLGKGSLSVPSMPGGIKKETGQEGESFTGQLKEAIARGVPMKCTYTQGDFTGTGFIKGKNYYGEISQEGKKGYVIMKDDCMWSWSEGENQGIKMCFEEDIWEQEEGTVPTEAEYYCSPTLVSDSQFNPPASVDFLDMDEMMGGMEE